MSDPLATANPEQIDNVLAFLSEVATYNDTHNEGWVPEKLEVKAGGADA